MSTFDPCESEEIRERVLAVLTPELVERSRIHAFDIVRTVDRKGYRHEQSFSGEHPYMDDPKTKIVVEIEVDDDATPELRELVADLIEMERSATAEKARRRLMDAELALTKAQAEWHSAAAALDRTSS